jgi:NAD(P)H-dependent FMN reductase
MTRILGISGSLRERSYNTALLRAAAELAPPDVELEIFDLSEVPLYNDDVEAVADPEPVARLRAAVAEADALLIATPEYNRGTSGVLKNAIDWLSRPYGNSALKDKPMAVVGASLGQYGGVWAHDETRKSFGIAGPNVVEAVKLSIPMKSLDGKHPRENAEVAANLCEVVGKLAAEVA